MIIPYPNPGNPKNPINIELQVVEPQNLSIKIFNILGMQVWSTEKTIKEPGIFTIRWAGENQNKKEISSGIYFIIAQGQYSSFTNKVTFLK